MEAMLFGIHKVCFERTLLVVNMSGTWRTVVSRGNKIDCTGCGGTTMRLGNDGPVFIASMNFEASIIRRCVAVIEDFLRSQNNRTGEVHVSRSFDRIGSTIPRTSPDRGQYQWKDRVHH
jgi:hypothetical protein